MKKLILLLLFIPLVSFGQIRQTVYNNFERELVLSDEKTTVITPLSVDLTGYVHLGLVRCDLAFFYTSGELKNLRRDRWSYGMVERELLESEFNVINPYYINPKKSRKEYGFWMETIKSPANLYLYIYQELGKGNDINTTLIIKNYLGKIIYQSNHINTGLNEILSPLISRKNYSPIPSDFIGFRNMKFTDTEDNLREKNPDIEFKEEFDEEMGLNFLFHEGQIAGIKTDIFYGFENNFFVMGGYHFAENDNKTEKERLNDYKNVSKRLNAKYKMKNNTYWFDAENKDNQEVALRLGQVLFQEHLETDVLHIIHKLGMFENKIFHEIWYGSGDRWEMGEVRDNDF